LASGTTNHSRAHRHHQEERNRIGSRKAASSETAPEGCAAAKSSTEAATAEASAGSATEAARPSSTKARSLLLILLRTAEIRIYVCLLAAR
jgi:hypothetical protein